ncbi:unnamed protein product [Anisakis simplex]|uniref:RING-type domain-containing protein n=1 Tax=Anisakis simplex TaxID=6269 RepID=A0A0M3K0P3_ANISI|nr:unnamed protein product [Anisakis simplex]
MPAITQNDSSESSSQKLVSFLTDGDDLIQCEVCLEGFHPTERPPKLLPCGHNFCEQCLFSLCCHQQRLSCLECCVNRHNGHQLKTLDELEYLHHKLINDLKQLNIRIQDVGEHIEKTLKELKNESIAHLDCGTFSEAKQALLSECERELNFAFSILENAETTPLPPAVITKMRQQHFRNSAKLYKMLNFIQKCKESVNEREGRHCRLKTKVIPSLASTTSTSNLTSSTTQMSAGQRSQSRKNLDMEAEYGTAADSIAALITIGNFGREVNRLNEPLKVLTRKQSSMLERRDAFLECAKQLKYWISDDTSKQVLLLFIDAYLNIFYQLNRLVSKYPRKEDPVRRRDVWKLVQIAYTELLRCASKHWPSQHPDRVDLVDDLAFLCSLYSDVCDQATITICMIEAARARAASDSLAEEEKHGQQLRLKLIDEHLLECRRIQKLLELRSTRTASSSQGRFRRLKRWWLRIAAVFGKRKLLG